ncbi:hypothetical protein LH51_07540 [Nitrincola sp. A-D6]|uniref:hypothetical protein n=1 Tax=Nitrincola sp. A-D6 TaxID=1545442 RepID=UPI00051FB13C|nr:hypothetical protein [Nitrincola sp. A-D6]KGK42372.1 hypothetical protein LH51_07540 [Nitrincola sp. A-D6]
MKESDWQKFNVIKEKAIEQFCTQTLNEFEGVIANTGESAHDRYLQLYQLVRNRDKEMAFIFDGHSRSKAPIQLMVIRSHGLADEALLAELSDEFRDQTEPQRFS